MLLRANQFHKSFKCLSLIFLCAQSEASIYHAAFVIFLYRGGVYLQTRLFVVPVWLMQESSQEKLKTVFYSCTNLGGKQSARRCTNNKSMKLILFSSSHCFPWFFNIIGMYSSKKLTLFQNLFQFKIRDKRQAIT